MSRVSTFLNTIFDNATVLYANFFLLLELVSVGVLNVMIVDDLCSYGVITTPRTHVLMATTAVVIVFVAIVFYNRVTNTFFDAKMATALRTAIDADDVDTPQKAADLVTYWREECSLARSKAFIASAALTGLKSQNEELRQRNETLKSENEELQNQYAAFCMVATIQMSAAPAPAVVPVAGAQI